MFRRLSFLLAAGVLAASVLLVGPQTTTAADPCPAGFACSLEFDGDPDGATPLLEPTDLKIGPNGLFYIVVQDGLIRLVDPTVPNPDDRLLPDPLIDISDRVDSDAEHGMMGMEFHPNFDGTNGYFYVFYTVLGNNPSADSFHRIARFEMVNGVVDTDPYDPVTNPDGELFLFETETIDNKLWHHGGMLRWGPDGKLYAGTGDNLYPGRADELDSSFGKILRMNPDGTIPADNPFLAETTGKYEAIWAKGLRHPYNIAFSDVWEVMYINEVGQSSWEEINTGIPGADYGWNEDQNDGEQGDPAFVDPTYTYPHSGGCGAITGGTFYEPDTPSFPAEYYGQYFFTDYCFDWIDIYDPDTGTVTRFSEGFAERLLRLEVDSEGNLWALKRLRDSGAGGPIVDQPASLYKFAFTDPFAPEMTVNPADQNVTEGSSATFSCAAAGNPTPSYQWQYSLNSGATWQNVPSGGTSESFTVPNVQPSYDGVQLRCVATNAEGSTNSAAATLTVSLNQLPQPTITEPSLSLTYSGGDTVDFAGTATDPEDGPLGADAFEWTVNHHHAGAIKPVSYTHLTLPTDPAGLNGNFAAGPVADGTTLPRVAGFDYALGAATQQRSGDTSYAVTSWDHGGDRNQSVTLPETDVTYTANFAALSNY
ncbi:MAG: hypothetical protein GYB64_15435, partial [Chloroflexi bacterium]|nr:hypothetical protein [Chloroflexota bacterium]